MTNSFIGLLNSIFLHLLLFAILITDFSIFTPYPGTPYYKKNISKVKNTEYQNFNQYQLVYKHDSIDETEARQLLESAYRKFIISKLNYIFLKKKLAV